MKKSWIVHVLCSLCTLLLNSIRERSLGGREGLRRAQSWLPSCWDTKFYSSGNLSDKCWWCVVVLHWKQREDVWTQNCGMPVLGPWFRYHQLVAVLYIFPKDTLSRWKLGAPPTPPQSVIWVEGLFFLLELPVACPFVQLKNGWFFVKMFFIHSCWWLFLFYFDG